MANPQRSFLKNYIIYSDKKNKEERSTHIENSQFNIDKCNYFI